MAEPLYLASVPVPEILTSHEISSPGPRSRIGVLGIDTFAEKNRVQASCVAGLGYTLDVLTPDARGTSQRFLDAPHRLIRLESHPLRRFRQVRAYLTLNRDTLHHVEVYPGGRFAWLYVREARRLGIPALTVERGDLVSYESSSRMLRMSMRRCYRDADLVWYREPYQGRVLAQIGARRTAFLPNAVPVMPVSQAPRTLDFLWVNRVIPERRADWFRDALASPELGGQTGAVVGVLDEAGLEPRARQMQAALRDAPATLQAVPYCDPAPWYDRARFFVLPATIVYANFALLEAMARGLVPIVSDVEGAREIITDGVSGMLFPHSAGGLLAAMVRASRLTDAEYAAMSAAARSAIIERFSVSNWCVRLASLYQDVAPHGAVRSARERRDAMDPRAASVV